MYPDPRCDRLHLGVPRAPLLQARPPEPRLARRPRRALRARPRVAGGLTMDFTFSSEEEMFREEVRAFIRDHLPQRAGVADGLDAEGGMADLPALFKWNQDLYAK